MRLRIDRFALTSNNITYGAFGEAHELLELLSDRRRGDRLHPGVGLRHRDRVARARAWRSASASTATTRWPTRSCCIRWRVDAQRFIDGAPHRRELHGVYNQYLRCSSDPLYRPERRGRAGAVAAALHHLVPDRRLPRRQRLLRRRRRCWCRAPRARPPTASASASRGGAPPAAACRVVGLTSPANLAFTRGPRLLRRGGRLRRRRRGCRRRSRPSTST